MGGVTRKRSPKPAQDVWVGWRLHASADEAATGLPQGGQPPLGAQGRPQAQDASASGRRAGAVRARTADVWGVWITFIALAAYLLTAAFCS